MCLVVSSCVCLRARALGGELVCSAVSLRFCVCELVRLLGGELVCSAVSSWFLV